MSDSPAHRSRQRDRRAARARRRRRRLFPLLGMAALVILGIALVSGGGGSSSRDGATADAAAAKTVLVARASKSLSAPVSSESVVQAPGGPLIVGGLDSTGSSVSGVFQLGSNGAVRPLGSLTAPLHDSAAAVLGGRLIVFGGGSETSGSEVQALPVRGGSASEVGQLPTVRSDLSAVTVGDRAYVLGGYDGQAPLDSVLSTRDGRSFAQVAKLPDPARYMAVGALGGRIYAFGGETAEEIETDAIREIDPRSGSARVVGHLPAPIAHASAVVLGGRLYVLGGEANGVPTDGVWRFDPSRHRVAKAGRLPFPVAAAGAAARGSSGYLIGGVGRDGAALSSVIVLHERRIAEGVPREGAKGAGSPSKESSAPASPPPFRGRLLIADRGNNRLIVVNARKQVLWRFPSHAHPAPPGGFYFPDDAFFTHGGAQIISNEEQNERIVQIAFPSGKLLWSYGHPGVTGSEPGYLHEPDDAYLWRNGTVSVADAQNCRVLIVSRARKVLREFGEPSRCEHEPPLALGSPNGDTPLRNGDLLVSEVNGSYVDEITRHGKLVWSVQLPISYPSDPQQLGPDRYLVADYATPGGIYEFNREGKILWGYHPSSGHGMLDHPSLAERLPGGLIAVNDDYRHRVVIIDPHSHKIVWQYGRTGSPGRSPDHLNTPDGFDLLSPAGRTPTHPYTG